MGNSWDSRIKQADAWLLGFLVKHDVPFVIVSGAATAFYGCRDDGFYDDLDLFLCPSEPNSILFGRAMDDAAKAAGRQVAGPFPPLYMARPNVRFTLDITQFSIDFNTTWDTVYFDEIFTTANNAKIGTMNVKIISVPKLIELTEIVLRNRLHNKENCARDVELLKACIERTKVST